MILGLEIIFTFVLFFLAIIFSFYVPGKFVLTFLGKDVEKTTQAILAWPIGYSFFILISYISAWLQIPYLALIVVGFIVFYVIFFQREMLKLHVRKINRFALILILFGTAAFTSMSFLSGLTTSLGLQTIGQVNATDGIIHIARIRLQAYAFPPVYAGFAGYEMRGYHYFYDFLLSRFVLFYHFSPFDLYYRLFPFIISFFYGLMLYAFSGLFTKRNADKLFILFFGYFGSSLGFVLSFFTKYANAGNGMGLLQQMELILDPSVIFSAGILLAGFYVYLKSKKLHSAVLVGLLLGLLMQLKIYAGIIALVCLLSIGLYNVLKKKNIVFVLTSLSITIFLTAITYLPNNIGVGSLIFAPFFLYGNFMKQNLFANLHWDMRMLLYRQDHKVFQIFLLDALSFFLFWILALGVRIAFLVKIKSFFQKKFWTEQNLLLTISIIFPLLLASLFVQSISIFDTVQFFWFVTIFVCIPVGIFYGNLFHMAPTFGKYLLIGLLIFISFGEFALSEMTYVLQPYYSIIPSSQMKLAHVIAQKVSQKDFLVVAPSQSVDSHGVRHFYYYPAPLLASLTGRKTYYEEEIPMFYNEKKRLQRKKQIEEITRKMQTCDTAGVAHIMHAIGSLYLVTTSDNDCQNSFELKEMEKEGNWSFWVAK